MTQLPQDGAAPLLDGRTDVIPAGIMASPGRQEKIVEGAVYWFPQINDHVTATADGWLVTHKTVQRLRWSLPLVGMGWMLVRGPLDQHCQYEDCKHAPVFRMSWVDYHGEEVTEVACDRCSRHGYEDDVEREVLPWE